LLNCLTSIKAADLGGVSYEVVIVENNSGDDLSDLAGDYKIINSGKNLGMGGGNNLGIKEALGDYILISNPDIVYQTNTIKELFYYLKNNSQIGLIGPKLLNPDGTLQYSCVRFPKIYIPILRRTFVGRFFPKSLNNYLMKSNDHKTVMEVDWLLGACFMLKKPVTPLFDERYFMYFEDVDLCRQIKSNGLQVVYYPSVAVTHDHIRASASKPWHKALLQDPLAREHLKSAIRYFYKWRLK
jgi:hypothetical protein